LTSDGWTVSFHGPTLSEKLREEVHPLHKGWVVARACVVHGLPEGGFERAKEGKGSGDVYAYLIKLRPDLGVGFDLFYPRFILFTDKPGGGLSGLGRKLGVEVNKLLGSSLVEIKFFEDGRDFLDRFHVKLPSFGNGKGFVGIGRYARCVLALFTLNLLV
jgi:hypothetical protein